MGTTKIRILEAAAEVFNQKGIANARLQHIADKATMSVGNLAYHFPHKDAMVDAVLQWLHNNLDHELHPCESAPQDALQTLDSHLSTVFHFLQHYHFIALDGVELRRNFPDAYMVWQKMVRRLLKHLSQCLHQLVLHHHANFHTNATSHRQVAEMMLSAMFAWMGYRVATGKSPQHEASFKQAVWTQLLPHLVPQARQGYSQLAARYASAGNEEYQSKP